MKKQLLFLSAILLVSASFTSCNDDDGGFKFNYTNTISFDGETPVDIDDYATSLYWEEDTYGEIPYYDLHIHTETLAGEKCFWFGFPVSSNGKKFTLTENATKLWYVDYEEYGEVDTSYYGDNEDMYDIDRGYIYLKKTGTDTFEIVVDVVFTDGTTLKVNYKGEMDYGLE